MSRSSDLPAAFHLKPRFSPDIQGKPTGTPQTNGRYISKEMFTKLRNIEPNDPPDLIDRKIRAFWYPPYPGALLSINGKQYTLIDNDQLQQIADHLFPARNRSAD